MGEWPHRAVDANRSCRSARRRTHGRKVAARSRWLPPAQTPTRFLGGARSEKQHRSEFGGSDADEARREQRMVARAPGCYRLSLSVGPGAGVCACAGIFSRMWWSCRWCSIRKPASSSIYKRAQVVAEPKDSNGAGAASTKPDPDKSSPSSSTNPGGSNPSGKKGDDAKPK